MRKRLPSGGEIEAYVVRQGGDRDNSIIMSSVPEKPALEGLETKWMAQWETEGTLSVRSRASAS